MPAIKAFHESMPSLIQDLDDSLNLTLYLRGDLPERVLVRVEPDNEELLVVMSLIETQASWASYQAVVPKSCHIDQTDYLFKLVWQDDSVWLGSAGLEEHMPRNIHMYRYCHDRRLPIWAHSQVFYQVFPERFANGDPSLTPLKGEYRYLDKVDIKVKPWDAAPEQGSGGFEFYGGDLPGLQSKLDYLQQELGITALYLNPVFESQSSHKYDTVDYFNVDPHFGGNGALESLTSDIHERGMKIVLDAVINHTSLKHPWFEAAKNGDDYCRKKYNFEGENYSSWKDHSSLPTLDFSNPDVVSTMVTGDNSVIRHWLKPPYNIDGWRMDVIHMLGDGKGAKNNAKHLRQLRRVIKEESVQAMLLGEHFFEATNWLQGDQEDCAMNYFGFGHPVRAFLAGLDISMDPIKLDGIQFARWLREARARISFDHQLLQFNQLDSHDTPRFLTMLKKDKALMKLSIGFLMTYIGTPCLYYGTEIGLEGNSDPDCRRPFPWDRQDWDIDIFEYSQRWIKHRKSFSSLSSGAIVDIYSDVDIVIFARIDGNNQTLVALNRGETKLADVDVHLPGEFGEWQPVETVNGEGNLIQATKVKLCLAEKSVQLWARHVVAEA